MKIKYVGARPRDIVAPGRNIHVKAGDVVEVGEKLGRSLLRQRRKFQPATPASKPKPAISAAEPKESSE